MWQMERFFLKSAKNDATMVAGTGKVPRRYENTFWYAPPNKKAKKNMLQEGERNPF